MPIRVVPVPALEDNYMYCVIDEETKQCGVVDPVDASAMLAAAERECLCGNQPVRRVRHRAGVASMAWRSTNAP